MKKILKIGLFLGLLCFLFTLGGCKSSKHKKERLKVEEVNVTFKPSKGKKSDALVDEAKTWLGTPYAYGTSEKGKHTDCSGMVLVIYEKIFEKKLPRNSAKQAEFCKKISKEKVKTGDLVFFATGSDKNKISHVGIMLDKESFIHASASKGVIISEITTPYYVRTFRMFGRVPDIDL